MPRIRSVHPDICQSEKMAQLRAELERTFVRLWTHCDDEGRCEDRPRILKAALYPEHVKITAESIDRELDELAAHKLIHRYEQDGRRYIQVRSWDEYQHPQRASKSKYPPPPATLPDDSGTPPRELPAQEGEGEGAGDGEGEGAGEGAATKDPLAVAFEAFWEKYPKNKAGKKPEKDKAYQAFKRISQTQRTQAFIAVQNYRTACDQDLELPKHAFRWLRDRTFEDWLTPAEPKPAARNGANGHTPYKNPEDQSVYLEAIR